MTARLLPTQAFPFTVRGSACSYCRETCCRGLGKDGVGVLLDVEGLSYAEILLQLHREATIDH